MEGALALDNQGEQREFHGGKPYCLMDLGEQSTQGWSGTR